MHSLQQIILQSTMDSLQQTILQSTMDLLQQIILHKEFNSHARTSSKSQDVLIHASDSIQSTRKGEEAAFSLLRNELSVVVGSGPIP